MNASTNEVGEKGQAVEDEQDGERGRRVDARDQAAGEPAETDAEVHRHALLRERRMQAGGRRQARDQRRLARPERCAPDALEGEQRVRVPRLADEREQPEPERLDHEPGTEHAARPERGRSPGPSRHPRSAALRRRSRSRSRRSRSRTRARCAGRSPGTETRSRSRTSSRDRRSGAARRRGEAADRVSEGSPARARGYLRSVLAPRAVDEPLDVRGCALEQPLRAGGGKPARGDRRVDLLLQGREQRLLQSVDRLALRGGDLRERLARAKLGRRAGRFVSAEVRRGGFEQPAARASCTRRTCARRRVDDPLDELRRPLQAADRRAQRRSCRRPSPPRPSSEARPRARLRVPSTDLPFAVATWANDFPDRSSRRSAIGVRSRYAAATGSNPRCTFAARGFALPGAFATATAAPTPTSSPSTSRTEVMRLMRASFRH